MPNCQNNFPKGSDFTTITQIEIDQARDKLNNKPRKCLAKEALTHHSDEKILEALQMHWIEERD